MPEPAETTTDAPHTDENRPTNTGAGAGKTEQPKGNEPAGEQPKTEGENSSQTPADALDGLNAAQKAAVQDLINQSVTDRLNREKDAARKRQERAQAEADEKKALEDKQFETVIAQRGETIRKLESDNAALQRQILILKVQNRYNLPDDIAERLRGETLEELDADGKKLKAQLAAPVAPRTEAGAGNKPAGRTQPAGEQPARPYAFEQPGDKRWPAAG